MPELFFVFIQMEFFTWNSPQKMQLFFDSNGIFHVEFIREDATANKTRYREILPNIVN